MEKKNDRFPAVFSLSVPIAIKVFIPTIKDQDDGTKWLVILKKEQNESMKKELKFYLGKDVSKLWVDITLMCVLDHKKQQMIAERFDNDAAGMKALHKWLKKHKVSFDENSLLVIEHRCLSPASMGILQYTWTAPVHR